MCWENTRTNRKRKRQELNESECSQMETLYQTNSQVIESPTIPFLEEQQLNESPSSNVHTRSYIYSKDQKKRRKE